MNFKKADVIELAKVFFAFTMCSGFLGVCTLAFIMASH